jgi:hypothetical protein
MLKNFLQTANINFGNWTMKNFCELEIQRIKDKVGDAYVLGGKEK